MMIALKIKKMIPKFLLSFLRRHRASIYNSLDKNKKFLNSINYCGFRLFYIKGDGLIGRLRFGSPDRIYERDLSEKIVKNLNQYSDPIFLDIGSNIGLISLFVLSKIKKVNIYSFEPGYIQFKSFDITIFANQIKNINLYNKAVGDYTGTCYFYEHENISDVSGDGLVDTKRSGKTKKVKKEIISLDDWWVSINKHKISIIKIDVEGAELGVLKGATEMLKNCKPEIYLEISKENLKVYDYDYFDVLEFLQKINYKVETLNGEIVQKENLEKIISIEDMFIAKSVF